MEVSINEKSYAIVEKLAYKFAYGNTSLLYDELLTAGLQGLEKAVNTFKKDDGTLFSTYATTCIHNAMCTAKRKCDRFDLTQDENVIIEDIDTLAEEMVEDDMEQEAKSIILRVNKNNQRNAEMFMKNIGLIGEKKMDYKELSVEFDISAERVRQVCVATRGAICKDKKATELLYSFVG